MLARDERAVSEAERAWSRGREGRPAARGMEENRALVRAIEWFGLALPVSFFGSWVDASGDFGHEIALCWKRSEQSLNSRRSQNSSAQNRIARLLGCCGNH